MKKVAHTFQEFSRGSDLVCRYGGEEFIIFLGNISSADALLRAESLREKIHHITLDYGAQKISSISISIGLALYPQDGLLPQTLIEAADKALYVAKNSGRDRVVLASSL